jgi:phage N-6-adenine-methyltransferase
MKCRQCKTNIPTAATGRPPRFCSLRCRVAAHRRRHRRDRRRLAVHFSSKTCEWSTPQELFDRLNSEHGFTLDACATAENAKCPRFYTQADDGLTQRWTGRVWCNPPYGRQIIDLWVQKAWEAAQTTAELVVLLVPARTDTRWWHRYCALGEVQFLPGRQRFNGSTSGAPFPSAVVVFRYTKMGAESVTKLTVVAG